MIWRLLSCCGIDICLHRSPASTKSGKKNKSISFFGVPWTRLTFSVLWGQFPADGRVASPRSRTIHPKLGTAPSRCKAALAPDRSRLDMVNLSMGKQRCFTQSLPQSSKSRHFRSKSDFRRPPKSTLAGFSKLEARLDLAMKFKLDQWLSYTWKLRD